MTDKLVNNKPCPSPRSKSLYPSSNPAKQTGANGPLAPVADIERLHVPRNIVNHVAEFSKCQGLSGKIANHFPVGIDIHELGENRDRPKMRIIYDHQSTPTKSVGGEEPVYYRPWEGMLAIQQYQVEFV